jgi:hypothetical protein
MQRAAIEAELDACLATPEEAQAIESRIQAGDALGPELDPFLPWPDIADILDAGGDDASEGHVHDGLCGHGDGGGDGNDDEGAYGRWEPGSVMDVIGGAAELQVRGPGGGRERGRRAALASSSSSLTWC